MHDPYTYDIPRRMEFLLSNFQSVRNQNDEVFNFQQCAVTKDRESYYYSAIPTKQMILYCITVIILTNTTCVNISKHLQPLYMTSMYV